MLPVIWKKNYLNLEWFGVFHAGFTICARESRWSVPGSMEAWGQVYEARPQRSQRVLCSNISFHMSKTLDSVVIAEKIFVEVKSLFLDRLVDENEIIFSSSSCKVCNFVVRPSFKVECLLFDYQWWASWVRWKNISSCIEYGISQHSLL